MRRHQIGLSRFSDRLLEEVVWAGRILWYFAEQVRAVPASAGCADAGRRRELHG
jgi:hypothetical protein